MQNVEGLWTAEIKSLDGWTNGGVVVLDKGRMFGGGEHFYVVGRYDLHDRVFTGDAHCSHFNGPSVNAFGDTSPDFRLTLRGRWVSDFIEGEMHRPDRPAQH